jgi:serine/threonine protein kinase
MCFVGTCHTLIHVFINGRYPKVPLYVAEATSNFAESRILGTGAFGTVYKGKVNGTSVAVKKIKLPADANEQVQVKRDFENEITVMTPLHHRNIIRLVGWCDDRNCLFQVYELIKKGNLEDHLYLPASAGAMDIDLHSAAVSSTASLLLDWPKR